MFLEVKNDFVSGDEYDNDHDNDDDSIDKNNVNDYDDEDVV